MRKCLLCGEELHGRSDKKFCSDQCRNAHNNHLNSDTTNYMRNVNNILRRNRRILSEIKLKTGRIGKEDLILLGFNFGFFTDNFIGKDGHFCVYCYDLGFVEKPLGVIRVVSKEDQSILAV